MAKVVVTEIGQEATILKYPKYEAFTAVIAQAETVTKAGTPYPANDATCKGYILHDVDTRNGAKEVAVVFSGSLKTSALTANGITVTTNAKNATPRVSFF